MSNLSDSLQNLSELELDAIYQKTLALAGQKLRSEELRNFWVWANATWTTAKGTPLTFKNRNYLVDIFQDTHPDIIIMKAAQMGVSEYLVAQAVWICDQLGKNVLYTFPTGTQLGDFVQARLDPVLLMSPYFKKRLLESEQYVQKIGLKRIGGGSLYMRGSQNEKQITSVDADCVDDKTEVLTSDGWKFFKDLSGSESVATLNSEGYLEYQKPMYYTNYEWNGDLVAIENQQVNLAVKPKHNLYIRKQRQERFELVEASSVFGYAHIEFKKDCKWRGKVVKDWVIPESSTKWEARRPNWGRGREQKFQKIYPKKELRIKPFLKFLGLYITEGCVSKQHSSWYNTVRLGQNRGEALDEIVGLLNRLGYSYKIYPSYNPKSDCHEVRIHDTQLARYLASLCGVGSRNKKIPKQFLELDSSLLEYLFDGLMLGDGGSRYFSTASKQLKDGFEELVLKVGYTSKTSTKAERAFTAPNGKRYISRKHYVISINSKKLTPRINKSDWKLVPYKGKVYCVTVPNGIIYVRRGGVSQWIGNCVILDERDRFVQEHVPFIDKRLLASDMKWRREVSTPTFSGNPARRNNIHAAYLNSDQRVWMIRCDKCKTWQELDFFKNVELKRKWAICSKCKKKIDRYKMGRWVAQNPDSSTHGYKISGLYNPFLSVEELIKGFNEATTFSAKQQFFNQVLGIPYEVEGQRLGPRDIDSCKRDFTVPDSTAKGCFAGADVGNKIHVVVSQTLKERECARYVWVGTVNNFVGPSDSLEALINQYNIKCMVVDARPETRKVKDLVNLYPGRVYGAYYPTRKFSLKEYFHWDEIKDEVHLDRTISLDYLVSDIRSQRIELPSNIGVVSGFYDEMTAAVRITERNERSKTDVARWVERGADHYFHAANYDRIARLQGAAGDALLDYYKEPSEEAEAANLLKWVRLKGQRVF